MSPPSCVKIWRRRELSWGLETQWGAVQRGREESSKLKWVQFIETRKPKLNSKFANIESDKRNFPSLIFCQEVKTVSISLSTSQIEKYSVSRLTAITRSFSSGKCEIQGPSLPLPSLSSLLPLLTVERWYSSTELVLGRDNNSLVCSVTVVQCIIVQCRLYSLLSLWWAN